MALQKKTLWAAIGGGALVVIFVGLAAVVTAPVSTPTTETNGNLEEREARIAQLLGNDSERINDPTWRKVAEDIISTENTGKNALLVIHSDTRWSGAVQNSDIVQKSIDGSGYSSIPVLCEDGGIYSLSFQKQTDYGVLNLYMAQDGKIIKQGNTGAEYGIVSFAGNCV